MRAVAPTDTYVRIDDFSPEIIRLSESKQKKKTLPITHGKKKRKLNDFNDVIALP